MKDILDIPSKDMALDHVAYLVRDTDASVAALSRIKKRVTVYREPLQNQGVYITFLEADDGTQKIELVEPFPENSVMQRRLDREGQDSILYHICYNVTDFDCVFRDMRSEGWLPLTKPFEGMNPGFRASHLYHPNFGVIEIAEVAAL